MDEINSKSERHSLTREQLSQPEAIELLALLQTVTEDGRVLDEEVAALHEWLTLNTASTLAGIVYLREAVETVLSDGRVTAEEREWLHKAVETVMPREQRSAATMARLEAHEEDRAARAGTSAEPVDEGERALPIGRFDFMVAGVQHDGRAGVIKAHCNIEDNVFLVREPRNRNSRHSIAVRLTNGMDIGYVPETDAASLSSLLDDGARQSASIKVIQEGRSTHIPVIWGELYPSDSQVHHAKAMSDAPAEVKGTGAGQGGSKVMLVLIALVVLVAVIVVISG